MILTFGGEKGGVGKSTLSVHLAFMLRAMERDPLLVDADPQGSATNFTAARDGHGAEPRVASVQKLGKGLAHECADWPIATPTWWRYWVGAIPSSSGWRCWSLTGSSSRSTSSP